MARIELTGFEELEAELQKMTITKADERKAMKIAIEPVAKELKANTPIGHTKRLSNVKATVKQEEFSTVGIVRSEAFYDVFQEYGTSYQKANVGYFDKSISSTQDKAVEILAKTLLK